MFLAAFVSLAGIGVMLWLLFTFAIYALPFYAGLSAAFLAYDHEAGWLGAGIVGLLVGRLHRHEAHALTRHRLADGSGVVRIGFAALDVRLVPPADCETPI